MNEFEMLRLIDIVDKVRRGFSEVMPAADSEPFWRIAAFLVKGEITGKPITISTLCDVTDVPYATSRRMINRLIDEGLIRREVRSKTGKSYTLHPSDQMIECLEAYARKMKSLFAQTVGVRSSDEGEEDYYFGGGQVRQPAQSAVPRNRDHEDLQFLMNDDNYALAVRNMWSDYRTNLGSTKDFKLMTCSQVHRELVDNSSLETSRYDVVGVNLPWLAEFVESGSILPIDGLLQDFDISKLHPAVREFGQLNGRTYGVPIYATANHLAVRKDLFDDAEIAHPRTFDQLISAGRQLSDPSLGRYGIVWDAARGLPIAHSFMFFMGDCGSPILSMRRTNRGYQLDPGRLDNLIPLVDSDAGRATLEFMHSLLEFSPPNMLDLAWDDALSIFLNGKAAMTYCWSMRAARFEYDIKSVVKQRVAYLPHPTLSGMPGAVPLGGFLLCVPSNLPPERREAAIKAINMVVAREQNKVVACGGLPVAPNFSFSADPEMRAGGKVSTFIDKWAQKGQLQTWQRPNIPEFHLIEAILGEEVHNALSGVKSDADALRDASLRMETVLSKIGCMAAA